MEMGKEEKGCGPNGAQLHLLVSYCAMLVNTAMLVVFCIVCQHCEDLREDWPSVTAGGQGGTTHRDLVAKVHIIHGYL